MEYELHRKIIIDASLSDVWRFFSSPHNLQKITPGYMNFRITNCPDRDRIFEGMRITYRVSPVLKVPVTWITLIEAVNEGKSFTDTQLKGPYKLWKHIHTFDAQADGILMRDDVTYALPMGLLGNMAHGLFVKKQLEDIFDYRETAIRKFFKINDSSN